MQNRVIDILSENRRKQKASGAHVETINDTALKKIIITGAVSLLYAYNTNGVCVGGGVK